jgi:hypothetical protein
MDHNAIIARAFEITRRHRALWIFGFLAAFASGSAGSTNFSNSSGGSEGVSGSASSFLNRLNDASFPGKDFVLQLISELEQLQPPAWFDPDRFLDPGAGELGGIFAGLLLLCGAFIVFILVMVVVRLISEAAIIRMVDAIEEGESVSFGTGLELGASGRTLRWFLLEILIGLLALIVIIPLLMISILPIVMMVSLGDGANAFALIMAIGLVLLGVPLLILFAIGYGLMKRLWMRELLVDGADMGSAVANAFGHLRGNLLSVLLLWFILLVMRLVYLAVSIPIILIALLIAAAVGIAVGALVFGAGASAIATFLLGFFLTLAFLAVPVLFLQGLFLIFDSSAWTLSWRWMRGYEAWMKPEDVHLPDYETVS